MTEDKKERKKIKKLSDKELTKNKREEKIYFGKSH
jgi:hypothetical protein